MDDPDLKFNQRTRRELMLVPDDLQEDAEQEAYLAMLECNNGQDRQAAARKAIKRFAVREFRHRQRQTTNIDRDGLGDMEVHTVEDLIDLMD